MPEHWYRIDKCDLVRNSFEEMTVTLLVLGLLGLLWSSPSNGNNDNKVTVGLFYETYCPDCKEFVTQQLWPTYQSLGDIMNVDLVPYGFAEHHKLENGTVIFSCQHGPRECRANMIHACVINLVQDIKKIMPFVHCMESDHEPATAGEKCCQVAGIDYAPIVKCFTSTQGVKFLIEEGKRTSDFTPEITEVPWITINSKFNWSTQRKALSNLHKVVCDAYKGPAIANCTTQI